MGTTLILVAEPSAHASEHYVVHLKLTTLQGSGASAIDKDKDHQPYTHTHARVHTHTHFRKRKQGTWWLSH